MNIYGKYSIMDGDKTVGQLEITQRGSMYRFNARTETGLNGIFRLAAISNGEIIPIGIMTPSGSGWGLDKTISPAVLKQMGVTEITGALLVGADMKNTGMHRYSAPEPMHEKERPVLEEARLMPEMKLQAENPAPDIAQDVMEKLRPTPEEVQLIPGLKLRTEKSAPGIIQNIPKQPQQMPETVQLMPEMKPQAEKPEANIIRNAQEILKAMPEAEHHLPEVIHEIPPAFQPDMQSETGETETGWQRENEPERLFKDNDIKKTCRDLSDTLVKTADGFTYLAVPVVRGRPFPAMPIFCFGNSRKINGKNYVVFKIKDGELIL